MGALVGEGASPERWARLGELMRDGRVRLGLTQTEASKAAKLGANTWGLYERGKPPDEARSLTLAAIDKLLDWPEGRAAALLLGVELGDASNLATINQVLADHDGRLALIEESLDQIARELQIELSPPDIRSDEDVDRAQADAP